MSTRMKFCPTCRNLLTPKENRRQKILVCRTCDYEEVADNNCVYRKVYHHPTAVECHSAAGQDLAVAADQMAADQTLQRTKVVCDRCGHGEAGFFQVTGRGQEGLHMAFVCCSCGKRWTD